MYTGMSYYGILKVRHSLQLLTFKLSVMNYNEQNLLKSLVLWPRTLSQGQGLNDSKTWTWDRSQGRGQGHCCLFSRHFEDKHKSSRTYHWLYLYF